MKRKEKSTKTNETRYEIKNKILFITNDQIKQKQNSYDIDTNLPVIAVFVELL